MPDVKEVIRSLETAVKNFERYSGDEYGREYDYARVEVETLEDAIALLKAQEPVVPIRMNHDENKYRDHYRCPICDDDLTYEQQYCAECGRAVKWE